MVSAENISSEGMAAFRRVYPTVPSRASATTRAILDRSTVVIADVRSEPGFAHGPLAVSAGFRSVVAVPMLREGEPIGVITVTRAKAGPIPADQIALLTTFADQAVIAIENVRLFTELQEKNHALTVTHGHISESLEQQTATGDILRVIASSPTDLEPVFDAILSNAARLCEATLAALWRYDGKNLVHGATYNASPEFVDFIKTIRRSPGPGGRRGGPRSSGGPCTSSTSWLIPLSSRGRCTSTTTRAPSSRCRSCESTTSSGSSFSGAAMCVRSRTRKSRCSGPSPTRR